MFDVFDLSAPPPYGDIGVSTDGLAMHPPNPEKTTNTTKAPTFTTGRGLRAFVALCFRLLMNLSPSS